MKNKKPLPKVTKNEVFAWILAGLMIFWTIASVLGIIGFAKSCSKDDKVVSASALTVDQVQYESYRLVKIPAGTKFRDEFNMLWFYDRFLGVGQLFGALEFTEPSSLNDYMEPSYYCTAITYDSYYLSAVDCMYVDYTEDGMITLLQDYYMSVYHPVDGLVTVEIEFTHPDAGALEDESPKNLRLIAENVRVEFINSVEDIQRNAYNQGYNYGLNKGLIEASDYSFFSLLSAVIDVPIQAFTSLFNFDLLGINLANFFYAIFTVCVILAVLRLIF